MSANWNGLDLLEQVRARGAEPAVLVIGQDGIETWDCEKLATAAIGVARGLRKSGLTNGTAVALWGPNSAAWIVVALGVLASGGVLALIDDATDLAHAEGALRASGARLIFASAEHVAAAASVLTATDAAAFLLDAAKPGAAEARGWASLLDSQDSVGLPMQSADDPAAMFWTSGTTGSEKGFYLTLRNIGSNVEALRRLGIVGPRDRALLPLPLHHAYPFVVGMLTPLACGTAIVLPGGATGPLLLQALRGGEVTTIVGVPRLHDAIVGAIESRVSGRNRAVRIAWAALLGLSRRIRRATGLHPGRVLFGAVRRGVGPKLRLLVSGGARLDAATAEWLEALGWTVLSGYGLAETASLFTGNLPWDSRPGSAGKPLGDGRVRIAHADAGGAGEIELIGSNITAGYLNNPTANQDAFTPDGWFRTGDLGFVDRDGFLFVTGRAKEVLVLGGGKKVNPEDLERVYGAAPEIVELAVLEHQGALVALVRPDAAKLRARGATNLRDGVRVVLGEAAQNLASYQRLSGFAVTEQPLPRTRLGKFRRFMMQDLYVQALGGGRRAARPPTEEDAALLRDPTAAAVWDFVRQRHPAEAVDLDVSPGLDLNLDSFAWMELTVALRERFQVNLTEADVAGIETLRDLLRLAAARKAAPAADETPAITGDIDRWLAPTGLFLTAASVALYWCNRFIMRVLFRLRTVGAERVPMIGPVVIAPNHQSFLDPMAIAASLPLSRLRRLYWAGDVTLLFGSAASRAFCRAVHLFPVDEKRPAAAVAIALRALAAGNALIWFPEGWRTPDGALQRFLPGVGQLLLRGEAPAAPASIAGAFEAWPRHRRWPRRGRITVTFGAPATLQALRAEGDGRTDEDRIAAALRARVARLAGPVAVGPEPAR